MTKLVTGVFLIYITLIQFYSVYGFDNATDLIDEDRFLISGIIANKCRAQLATKSSVLPNVGVTLTRLSNGRQYFFSPASSTATYADALTFCKDHGMHLVTIDSAGENILVYAKATQLGIAQADPVLGAWIGYRDVTGTGTYQWVYPPKAGTPPTFFLAPPPLVGECAGYTNVVPAATPAATSWLPYPCDELHPFICELEPPCSLVL